MTALLNLEALKTATVSSEPFPYLTVPNFIHSAYLPAIHADYPKIEQAGSFPLSSVNSGPRFNDLVEELKSDALKNIIAEKFSLDLTDKPVLITVRGKADHNDGKIHTDSKTKIITLLLYMNEDWHSDEGKLRILRDNKNLDNYAAEITPTAGNALLFKVTDNGWHGHKPIIGVRKVIQLNYLASQDALSKHYLRHKVSANLKKLAHRLGLFRK